MIGMLHKLYVRISLQLPRMPISVCQLNKNAWQKPLRSASDFLLALFIENCRELACHFAIFLQIPLFCYLNGILVIPKLVSIPAFSGILPLTSACSSQSSHIVSLCAMPPFRKDPSVRQRVHLLFESHWRPETVAADVYTNISTAYR